MNTELKCVKTLNWQWWQIVLVIIWSNTTLLTIVDVTLYCCLQGIEVATNSVVNKYSCSFSLNCDWFACENGFTCADQSIKLSADFFK